MEDDDAFGNIECEEYEPKGKKSIPKVDYTPKIDDHLWFLDCIDKEEMERILKKDLKELKVKENVDRKRLKVMLKSIYYKIDYLYLNQDYEKCLECCQQIRNFNRVLQDKTSKLLVPDLEIRCSYRLGHYQSAIDKIIKFEESTLSNINRAAAQKYMDILILYPQSLHHLLRFNESIVQYQKCIVISNFVWEWWFNMALAYIGLPIEAINKNNYKSLIDGDTMKITNQLQSLLDQSFSMNNNISDNHLFCAHYSLKSTLYFIQQSINVKKRLDAKLNYAKPLQSILVIIQHLLDQCNIDHIDIHSTTLTTSTTIPFNDFEIKHFVEFKEMLQPDDDDEEEINPYDL
ncbi:hypothetical protein DFA_10054 [Cavenderia fasciculata]|uniref:Uncharacterized protein n=1 Tax=Cavenderia fasciculata TaxID=261658 RepID=F4Q955_CACFS|nr:uncharacterized protein DFA_10054 [Cavenderia fasciculata]EGG15224.1 hypothetical protein DFA_10054 [Cavenderia fasciculata]|eukprot:XP_004351944.1 hypothetical protein DFA_10054 [Cavenderia fasciculata]